MTKTERINQLKQQIQIDEERAERLHGALSENLHDINRELWLILFEQWASLEEFIKRSKKRLEYEERNNG